MQDAGKSRTPTARRRRDRSGNKAPHPQEILQIPLLGPAPGHPQLALFLPVFCDREVDDRRGPHGPGGLPVPGGPPPRDPHRDIPPRARLSQREAHHAAAALVHRHRRSHAELLRVPTHAARRRLGHRLLRACLHRHLRPDVPEGALRLVQRLLRRAHSRRSGADHAAPEFVRPDGRLAGGVGAEDGDLGGGGRLLGHPLRRQRLRLVEGPQGHSFFRHHDQLRFIRSLSMSPGDLSDWGPVFAPLRHRPLPDSRPRFFQFFGADSSDPGTADGASGAGGHRQE